MGRTALETLRLDVDARGVARLTLARPEKRNAISARMIAELAELAQALGRDPAVRVVVLAAEGPMFCAGGDLDWMRTQIGAGPEARAAEASRLAAMLGALDRLPKPLIGRIHGDAFGGGVGLMAVCDAAVAVEGARFGLTEVRLGLIPATIGPYVLARIGGAAARRWFFSGRLFGTAEAERIGLVARTVPQGDLDAAVEAEVAPYLAAAPGAVAEGKALARRLTGAVGEAQVAESVDALVARWESREATEGIDAFFGKRRADWVREE